MNGSLLVVAMIFHDIATGRREIAAQFATQAYPNKLDLSTEQQIQALGLTQISQ
ncbi:MAG: hypothetical protein JO331_08715 [Verrucomicrobia bacterium]|nr:hypothetical protein [Verrucomicrobiota bacterium]